jgi:acetyl esterase/lipase
MIVARPGGWAGSQPASPPIGMSLQCPVEPRSQRTRCDVPPAYIEVGQLDLFRDEDTAYATKLSRVGVPVELHRATMRPL